MMQQFLLLWILRMYFNELFWSLQTTWHCIFITSISISQPIFFSQSLCDKASLLLESWKQTLYSLCIKQLFYCLIVGVYVTQRSSNLSDIKTELCIKHAAILNSIFDFLYPPQDERTFFEISFCSVSVALNYMHTLKNT